MQRPTRDWLKWRNWGKRRCSPIQPAPQRGIGSAREIASDCTTRYLRRFWTQSARVGSLPSTSAAYFSPLCSKSSGGTSRHQVKITRPPCHQSISPAMPIRSGAFSAGPRRFGWGFKGIAIFLSPSEVPAAGRWHRDRESVLPRLTRRPMAHDRVNR